MLRKIFGLPRRVDEGLIKAVNETIADFCKRLRKEAEKHPNLEKKYARWDTTADSFIISLDELEQSKFASEQYRMFLHSSFLKESEKGNHQDNEMSEEELEHYRLHMYYYKNAFVRIFATLDKLGYFLNDFFEINTQKEKAQFSYFTVLRQMHKNKLHEDLEQKLYDLKAKYQDALYQLRTLRNMEIHSGNIEVQDDLLLTKSIHSEQSQDENLQLRMRHLGEAYEMVCLSLSTVFTYCRNSR